jgi:hypothetical protein
VIDAVRSLVRICPDKYIAGVLNRNGLQTGRGNRWTCERVTSMRGYHKIPCHCPERAESDGWMTLGAAADWLGISARTLRLAVERGVIAGEHPLREGPWIINRRALETEAARRFVAGVHQRNTRGTKPAPGQKNFDFSGT